MALSPEQQLAELFSKSEHILILLPDQCSGDAFGAALGLDRFLEHLGKSAVIATKDADRLKEQFSFLRPPRELLSEISGVREFILSFDTKHNRIVSVRTEEDTEAYRIFITPEKGSIDPRDFSFIPAKFSFDLVVTLDAPDKEHFEKISENNPDIFYEVPIINIDRHAGNEHFGQVNIVDMTAAASSEIVANILEKVDEKLVDEHVADPLLAGIISATESFQRKNTTPGALQTASRLMDRGANQQSIITHLYRTQPLRLLKLWGRAMAGLRWHESIRLVSAAITPEDLVETRSHIEDLPSVLEKIRAHFSLGAFFLLLFRETPTSVRATLLGSSPDKLEPLLSISPEGPDHRHMLSFSIPANTLDDAELLVLDRITTLLPKPQEE